MREFTCVICGAKAIDRSRNGIGKYCSVRCRDKYHYYYGKRTENPCLYNEGVVCQNHQCDGCGWNPDVQKDRAEKIMGV